MGCVKEAIFFLNVSKKTTLVMVEEYLILRRFHPELDAEHEATR